MSYIRGGSNHQPDPDLLKGVLASEYEDAVYPDDHCLLCLREGVAQSSTCFHRHWRIADESPPSETRDSINN